MRVAHLSSTRRLQRGLSLVELMVGITVGLFVVAAASALVANQLTDNRRLLLETQVQQDLRASMDIITRQLRRAGSADPAEVQAGLAIAEPPAGGASNPLGSVSPPASPSTETIFSYRFDASQAGPYGFKLEDGVIKSRMKDAVGVGYQWQDLTDRNTIVVTSFTVTPRAVASTPLPCPKLCPAGDQACWPKLVVRSYVVDIEARAKSDPGVRRGLRNDVRIRNDLVQFNGSVCPA